MNSIQLVYYWLFVYINHTVSVWVNEWVHILFYFFLILFFVLIFSFDIFLWAKHKTYTTFLSSVCTIDVFICFCKRGVCVCVCVCGLSILARQFQYQFCGYFASFFKDKKETVMYSLYYKQVFGWSKTWFVLQNSFIWLKKLKVRLFCLMPMPTSSPPSSSSLAFLFYFFCFSSVISVECMFVFPPLIPLRDRLKLPVSTRTTDFSVYTNGLWKVNSFCIDVVFSLVHSLSQSPN